LQIVLNEFRNYKPQHYNLTIDGKTIEEQALMIVFANSNQFGFNTRIAPQAKVDDGLLDICIVKKMPASQLLNIGYHTMRGTLATTGYIEYLTGKEISINNPCNPLMNIDGEPKIVTSPINISIKPLSLCVIVP